jgi:hypothetical protein
MKCYLWIIEWNEFIRSVIMLQLHTAHNHKLLLYLISPHSWSNYLCYIQRQLTPHLCKFSIFRWLSILFLSRSKACIHCTNNICFASKNVSSFSLANIPIFALLIIITSIFIQGIFLLIIGPTLLANKSGNFFQVFVNF